MDDGIAAATTALMIGLFAMLKKKGLFMPQDLRDIFEAATLGLEEQGLVNTPTGQIAHGFLSQIQMIVEGLPSTPTADKP